MTRNLAPFKYAPSGTIPNRQGPVQCVRNCTNCIMKQINDNKGAETDVEEENIIAIKSFDNLLLRRSVWFSSYQTIQYHLGQVDVLKQSLKSLEPTLVIYVVATPTLNDIKYLQLALEYVRLPRARARCTPLDIDRLESDDHIIVPINMSCCVNSDETPGGGGLLDSRGLSDFLAPIVNRIEGGEENTLKVALVPASISKDHDRKYILGVGSLCMQIIEPISLQEYLHNIKTQHKTSHLVQHLYHDLAHNSARLPAQVVAFLLLYLDRPSGVSRDDLVSYLDWLRKSSMEFNLHMAFTGDPQSVVEFALMILEDYIHFDTKEQVFMAINIKVLTQYANSLIPNVAYYGIISRAILMLYNRDEKNSFQLCFNPDVQFKVMRDDLLELGQDLAERIDHAIPCRRPCVDVRTQLITTFDAMKTFGKYFWEKEARVRPNAGLNWLGEYDSDDEYFKSKRGDPAFKPWIILTQRPYRLDRLNLFMNAMEAYLCLDDDQGNSEYYP